VVNFRWIKCVFLTALTAFSFLAYEAQASEAAWFKILGPDGQAMQNTTLFIYNGDVKFKNVGRLYPYGDKAYGLSHFLTAVKSDEGGNFGIKIQNFSQRHFTIIPGYVYYPIDIEQSDDLSHNFSPNHIRVVMKQGESTQVVGNDIYEWRKRLVSHIPMGQEAGTQVPAERIILRASYLPILAPVHGPLNAEDVNRLLAALNPPVFNRDLLADVHKATKDSQLTLRAYAMTYLGKYGTAESVAYLIDGLSDESVHVGARYKDQAMAVTRYRAKLALNELTGEDFGFIWDAPLAKRQVAINQWKRWLNERDGVIDVAQSYLQENDMGLYDIYRAHLNHDKTVWQLSLSKNPPRIGAPTLSINRQTHDVEINKGR
jgi:hypothetical protein